MTTWTLIEYLEDQIVVLDMWLKKKEDSLPVTRAYLDEARRVLEGALHHASRGE